jgi:two-component system phosphate regulon sensor histidine kinase PhoR
VKITFRWKLMGSYLCLVLLMGGVLYGYLNHTLGNYLLTEIKDNLANETKLAALMSTREMMDLRRDAPAVAAVIGKEIKARVTIITNSGEVVGDSEVSADELRGLENHRNRPEILAARRDGTGTAIRYSSTLQTSMLYVARPLILKSGEGGTIRLAIPLALLDKTRSILHTIVGAAIALTLLAALVLSYVLSNFTSRSLRTMAAAAAQLGKGKFGLRVPVKSSDELGELAMVMNDMSTRIERQLTSISAERNRLDTILRGMGEGLMVTDARGVITLVNPAFRDLFAIGEEIEGRPLIDISRHPALHNAYKSIIASKCEQLEEITLHAGGEKTILTHWVPLLDGDRLQGVVAVFHDISNIKRLEKIRRDFVANVSHELRTPVSVIKGYAETLLSGTLASDPGRAVRFVEIIHSHSERLAALIGDLLILSELESGDSSLELTRISIEESVRHALTLLEQKAASKGITIDSSTLAGAPSVMADLARLEQVFINLLDNAIKYTAENGSVAISATDAGKMLKISVTDSGMGIPAKDLPRIFERFYRVDEARGRDQGGTGLGLSIVKHIVQAHGGTLSVESCPGQGSTFSFTLKKAGTE